MKKFIVFLVALNAFYGVLAVALPEGEIIKWLKKEFKLKNQVL